MRAALRLRSAASCASTRLTMARAISCSSSDLASASPALEAPAASAASFAVAFETLALERPAPHVIEVRLNRPDKSNAMNRAFWREIRECFDHIDSKEEDCRVVLLSGAGRNFTAGLDLMDHAELFSGGGSGDVARRALSLRRMIAAYQDSFSAIERCAKPVIAAIHGACIGGGVDMVSAADIRVCASDAYFSIKEVELGLAADVGTLQRLPRVVGNDSWVRELALTGRNFPSDEALRFGFVSAVLPDAAALRAHALALATKIASHSPVAVLGTKENLNFARDHPTATSLRYQVAWNAACLQTEDIPRAAEGFMTKKAPTFAKL